MPREQPPVRGKIMAVAPARAAMGRREVGPASGVNDALPPSRGWSDLPILIGHTRPGVPSSVASSQR